MKKVVALIVALVSALAISVAAFAADPSYDSSVNGSKAITQDTCVSWLISQDKNGKLTEDVLNTGYLWSVYEARHVITATLRSSDEGFGYQFWYDDDGTFTVEAVDLSDYFSTLPKQSETMNDYLKNFFSFLPPQVLALLLGGIACAVLCRVFGR